MTVHNDAQLFHANFTQGNSILTIADEMRRFGVLGLGDHPARTLQSGIRSPLCFRSFPKNPAAHCLWRPLHPYIYRSEMGTPTVNPA